jgi:hypothetical protein
MTYPVHYDIQYPERSARWKPVIWKLVTSVSHFIILAALMISLVGVIPIGWAGILIQGRFPKGLHQYATGVLRWGARVQAYVLSLTDEFPPFSLSADPAPAGRNAATKSAVVGTLLVGGVAAVLVAFVMFGGQHITKEISYQRLLTRAPTAEERTANVHSGVVQLTATTDPADEIYAPLLRPQAGQRFLEFELAIKNERGEGDEVLPLGTSHFSLKDTARTRHALLAMVGGKLAPADIGAGETATVRIVFELPIGAAPEELRYDVLNYNNAPRVGETIVYKFY